MAETKHSVLAYASALFYIERVAMLDLIVMPYFTQNLHSFFAICLFVVTHIGYVLLLPIAPYIMEHHGGVLIFVFERIAIILWGLSSCYIELWSLTVSLLVTFNTFHILRWFVGNPDDTMPVEQNTNVAELDKAETDKENSLLEEELSQKLNCGSSAKLVETILAAEFTENTRTEYVEANDDDKDGAAETNHNPESDQVSYKRETKELEDEVNESAEDDIPPLIDEEVKLQTGTLTPHQLMKICEPKAKRSNLLYWLLGKVEAEKMAEERRAHPDCINASNPYHECVEYCFNKIAEAKAWMEKKDPDGAAETKHNLESDQVSYKQETEESEDEVKESAEDDIPPLIDEEEKLQTGTVTPYQLMKICEPKARDIDEQRKSLLASGHSEASALTDTMWSIDKDRRIISKLEDEKKDLSAKLDAAIESLEHYRTKAITDERCRLEGERYEFSAKLDVAIESLVEHYRIKMMEFTDERCRLEGERNHLSAKLFETNHWYEHYFFAAEDLAAKYSAIVEERNRLAAKLQAACTVSEHYKSCNRELEETCRDLRQENLNLCARISEECSSTQSFSDLFYVYEEKCRRLEEDKINLTAKLIAAKARAELYQSFLHEVDP